MALTLNNFTGFETGDSTEAVSTVGGPTYDTLIVRSGGYSMTGPVGARYNLDINDIVTDGGSGIIFGVAIRLVDNTPDALTDILLLLPASGSTNVRCEIQSNGDLRIYTNGVSLTTITAPFSANTWHYIEIYAAISASGGFEIFIDGTSKFSSTTADTGTVRPDHVQVVRSGPEIYFDDIYILTGATAASQRYGTGFKVKGYKSNVASATDNGSALNTGTWNNVGSIPWSDASSAIYSTNGANGSTDTDTSTPNTGPSGDADVTGATIKGAKWALRASRSTGSDSAPFLRYGSTGGTTDTGNILTTTAANYLYLSETVNVPTTSQYFQLGMGKGSGGRNPTLYEAMGMLAFVSAAPAVSTLNFLSFFELP